MPTFEKSNDLSQSINTLRQNLGQGLFSWLLSLSAFYIHFIWRERESVSRLALTELVLETIDCSCLFCMLLSNVWCECIHLCVFEGGRGKKTASWCMRNSCSTPVLSLLRFLFVILAHIAATVNITRRESVSTSEQVERQCGGEGEREAAEMRSTVLWKGAAFDMRSRRLSIDLSLRRSRAITKDDEHREGELC